MNTIKNKKNTILSLTFLLYPFFPLIKEWNSSIGLVIEAVLLVFLLMDSIIQYKNGHVVFNIKKRYLYLITFMIIYFLLNVKNFYEAFSGFRCFLLYIIIFQEISRCEKTVDAMESVIKPCIITTFIMSLGCLIQFIMPDVIKNMHNPVAWDSLRYKTDWTSFGIYNRAISFMTDPNVLSVFLVFSMFIVYEYYLYTKHRLSLLISLMALLGIVLTQSRTGILIVVIYILLSIADVVFRRNKVTPFKLMIFIVLLIITIVCVVSYWEAILNFLRVDTLLSGNGRFDNNTINLDMLLLDDPIRLIIGNGLYDGRDIILENSYIGLLYMFGIVGLLVLIILSYLCLKDLIVIDNIKYVVCYALAIFVGDYILIPQITIIFIALLFFKSQVKKV